VGPIARYTVVRCPSNGKGPGFQIMITA
jgi:hypothetical protein